jgi:hypothetical protein
MPDFPKTNPVEDSVPKVNDEIAVGSDLKFQRRWWRFEKVVWTFFTLILILNLAGVFGRGPVAKARKRLPDGSMDIKYERIERYGTPSILEIRFGPDASRDGKVQVWASESLVKALGTERVIPQPLTTFIGNGGLLYTFAANRIPGSIEFDLQPAKVGSTDLRLQVPGHQEFRASVFVMP